MAENRVIPSKVILIGGSAGSLEIILNIISILPATGPFIYIIITHRKSSSDSIFENLLASRTTLPVKEVEDKEALRPRTIYIAPADYHLLIEDKNTFSLDASEKVQFSRPSIDVSFESAAEVFGSSVTAILLSGANSDGAKGLKKIEISGGVAIVQDPSTADVSYMPEQALKLLDRPAVVSGNLIPQYLLNLLNDMADSEGPST